MTIDDALPQGEVSTASRAPRDVPIIRVLAIDGGGLRGIIPLRVLMELERLTGRGAATLFDVVAGTSTGGVVALALCRPDADGKPAMSAAKILEIYCEWAPKIFIKPKLRTAVPLLRQKASRAAVRQRVGALVTPRRYGNARYSAEGIGNLYKDCLGDARLVDALTDVIVPVLRLEGGAGGGVPQPLGQEGRHEPHHGGGVAGHVGRPHLLPADAHRPARTGGS